MNLTEEQIAAAQLRIILDRKLGRDTPELVRHIASATASPEPEPALPKPEPTEPLAPQPEIEPSSPLAAALGVELSDELLTLALTHRSYAYEHGGLPPNERLEFLGDAILGSVVTDHLYRTHPDLPEGQLAKLRASVVNMHALAEVARELGLGGHLLLGRGEEATGGRDKESILADAMEAVIGAVYLEHGAGAAQSLVHRLLGPLLAEAPLRGPGTDWKTALVALISRAGLSAPEYDVVEMGPDHDKRFVATVLVDSELQGFGVGQTKRQAEQQAAENAWRALSSHAEPGTSPG